MHLHNINFHARLRRHARNVQAFQSQTVVGLLKKFKIISIIVTLILPIYPSFGSVGLGQEYAVGAYDESTIISSYDGSEEDSSLSLAQESGFLRPGKVVDGAREADENNSLINYTVSQGDTIGAIASRFGVSENSILWSNSLDANSVIKPGQSLRIPPSSGLLYAVQAGETVAMIADKYKIDAMSIFEKNQLDPSEDLHIGQQIFLPGAKQIIVEKPKEEPKKEEIKSTEANSMLAKNAAKKAAIAQQNRFAKSNQASKQATAAKKSAAAARTYASEYTGRGNKFAYGNCTYYVANHKNVTWRGNAREWLRNARAAGVPTGTSATAGAIIVFMGSGYNSYYGHVGIVSSVDGDDLIIKDMNYRRYNEVTVRRVDKNDPSIRGYIYTN